jgi:spore germination cell wall hydrolase CwlJ-like protein
MNIDSIKAVVAFVILSFILYITYNPVDSFFVKEESIEQPVSKVIDPKQLACMTKNIFYEAGNESIMGQAAVARVVLNRINHGFAKTPCAVVYQSNMVEKIVDDESVKVKQCQFSWVCEGKNEPNVNSQRYQQAQQVAYEVMANDAYSDVVPKSALFFHNLSVDPLWPYKQVAKIGNHIFYSKIKKSKDVQKTSAYSENNI